MALTIKSRSELIRDLENAVKNRDSSIETGFGPVKDIVIDPVSLVGRDLFLQVKNVFDIQFLKNADLMSVEELNLLGESFDIKRKAPQSATGTVFFRTTNQPSTDLRVPSGTPVATGSRFGQAGVQQFVTTRAVTLPATSATAFFNAEVGVFEVEAPIRAIQPGSRGRVSANTITTLQRSIQGFSSITNKSATIGGRDFESNREYARRISLALTGVERGTINGLKRFTLLDNRVIDARIVQGGDPLMIRAEDVAGAVDVYVLGEEPVVFSQTETFNGLDIFFDNEPIIFPNPVIEVRGDVVGLLTEGTHYFIIRDPVLEGSTTARNVLRFNRGVTGLPSFGEGVTLQYTYDKLIVDLQDSVDAEDNDLLADILMRRATQVDVAFAADVRISPESNSADVEAALRSAITEFINNLGLGENVVPSDLDIVIRSVPGVDFVFLPFDQLSRVSEDGSDIVVVGSNEYAQIQDSDIVLTLSV